VTNEKIPFALRKEALLMLQQRIVAWPALSTLLLDQLEANIAKVCEKSGATEWLLIFVYRILILFLIYYIYLFLYFSISLFLYCLID
jgi:hypothetical protein